LLRVASAVEPREEVYRKLGAFLELPRRVRISEKVLYEHMDWGEYLELAAMYSNRLTRGARTARMDAMIPGEEEVS
jgi:hypothetical protein